MEKLYEYTSEFYRLPGHVPLALYKPKEKSPNSRVAILAMHRGDYLSFPILKELAKHGFVAAGANPSRRDAEGWLLNYKTAVEFMRSYPGVKKLVLLGHSQGGCMMSCYQYIAENGAKRFQQQDRLVPFPELPELPKGDGLMLLDSNYGIMEVLAMDPSVRNWDNGFDRIPELDLYNPENGYDPKGSHYTDEFIARFQKAQIEFYEDVLNYCRERMEAIRKGRGRMGDDEPLFIAGSRTGSSNNKLLSQDIRLLGRTKEACPTLISDGSIVEKVSYTVRPAVDARKPDKYDGGVATTVKTILADERRFHNFGYNECEMWGDDWDFNYLRTCGNVKGIHVPLLITGNTGSHEFINAEMNYVNAVSEDKSLIIVEGATHNFDPIDPKYGDTLGNAGTAIAGWLAGEGRFLD